MASILIIDDSPQIRKYVRFVLEMKGHDVRAAEDGGAGLKAQRERQADLILCDLFMPEKEGLETIRELRHEFPQQKIIALSGDSHFDGSMDFLAVALRLGAAATLRKPFSPADLVRKVEQLLSRQDADLVAKGDNSET